MTSTDQPILDYAAFEAAPVESDPYAHIIVPNFVRPDDLRAIVASMPDLKSGGSFPPESLALSPLVRSLVDELQSARLRDAIAKKFDLDLSDAPSMLTMRGATRKKDGRIHRDSIAKRVTVLLYLNPANEAWARQEGCLRLLRGPDDVEDFVAEVPPVNGTLLVFPNGPTTWHGHRQYVGRRYTIQLNYMQTGAKARSELRRHRLSSLVKKLPFVA